MIHRLILVGDHFVGELRSALMGSRFIPWYVTEFCRTVCRVEVGQVYHRVRQCKLPGLPPVTLLAHRHGPGKVVFYLLRGPLPFLFQGPSFPIKNLRLRFCRSYFRRSQRAASIHTSHRIRQDCVMQSDNLHVVEG